MTKKIYEQIKYSMDKWKNKKSRKLNQTKIAKIEKKLENVKIRVKEFNPKGKNIHDPKIKGRKTNEKKNDFKLVWLP